MRTRRIAWEAIARKCARLCQFASRLSMSLRYASFTSAVACSVWSSRSRAETNVVDIPGVIVDEVHALQLVAVRLAYWRATTASLGITLGQHLRGQRRVGEIAVLREIAAQHGKPEEPVASERHLID